MSTTLSFILKFKDASSGAANSFGSKARSAFNVVDNTLTKVNRNLHTVDRNTNKLNRSLNKVDNNRSIHINVRDLYTANQQTERLNRNIKRTRDNAHRGVSLGGVIGAGVVAYGGLNALHTAAGEEGKNAAVSFATNNHGAQTLSFLRKESERLGQVFPEVRDGALSLYGAMRGGKIQLDQQNKIVTSILEGASAMHLSGEAVKGILLAESQIASKGVVAAEELRGQIGERLPGAFAIAARAMGMTEERFNKMLNTGKVMAADFLPKFARAMHQTFGVAAVENAQKATAWLNRYKTAAHDLKVFVGNELLPTGVKFIKEYLIPGAKWLKENWSWIKHVGGVAITAIVGVKALAVAQGVLNAAMMANPAVIVAAAIGTLVYGMVQAYGKIQWFTDLVNAAWRGLKMWGNIIGTVMDAIGFSISKGQRKIQNGIKDAVTGDDITKVYKNAGAAHGTAYVLAFESKLNHGSSDISKTLHAQMPKTIQERQTERWDNFWRSVAKGVFAVKKWFEPNQVDITDMVYSKHRQRLKDAKNPFSGSGLGSRVFPGKLVTHSAAGTLDNPAGLSGSGLDDFKSQSEKITSGGPRIITFNIDALNKSVYHVAGGKEAAQMTNDITEEGLLRLLHSLGALNTGG